MKKAFVLWTVMSVVLLCLTPACSTSEEAETYDIRGTWTMTMQETGESPEMYSMLLGGDLSMGSAVIGSAHNGTYTVSGNQVTIDMDFGPVDIIFTGTITSNNAMSGTFTATAAMATGTWSATR